MSFQFGHYFCLIKTKDIWLQFDDETIQLVSEIQMNFLFGCINSNVSAYTLFYKVGDH
ncbi:MAG: hypothetical protein ACK56F_18030 [bacterium]